MLSIVRASTMRPSKLMIRSPRSSVKGFYKNILFDISELK